MQFGPSRSFSLIGGSGTVEAAARVFDAGDGPVAGLVRFEWDALTWFEEDEPIYEHPRNPMRGWTRCARIVTSPSRSTA